MPGAVEPRTERYEVSGNLDAAHAVDQEVSVGEVQLIDRTAAAHAVTTVFALRETGARGTTWSYSIRGLSGGKWTGAVSGIVDGTLRFGPTGDLTTVNSAPPQVLKIVVGDGSPGGHPIAVDFTALTSIAGRGDAVVRTVEPETRVHILTREATWAFGAVVALSVKEALTRLYNEVWQPGLARWALGLRPDQQSPPNLESVIPPLDQNWLTLVVAVRLGLFLGMIFRFYIGAVRYFHESYGEGVLPRNCDARKVARSFTLDFWSGLVHFVLFAMLSMSVAERVDPVSFAYSNFLILLALILLWDEYWFRLMPRWHYGARRRVDYWRRLNFRCFLWCLGIFLLCHWLQTWSGTQEILVLLPALIVTLFEGTMIISGHRPGPAHDPIIDILVGTGMALKLVAADYLNYVRGMVTGRIRP